MLLRYDSNRIIAYGTCDSSYDSSTSSHHDYRPNYCPTQTLVQEGNVPAVNNVIDWSSGVTVFSNKAFALQYTTTASKALECCFFMCKSK